MEETKIPKFSELMTGPKDTRFCEKFFIGCAEMLQKDGYTADAIENGMVNAAMALAKDRGQLVTFMTDMRSRITKRMDEIGDYILTAEEERRKSAN